MANKKNESWNLEDDWDSHTYPAMRRHNADESLKFMFFAPIAVAACYILIFPTKKLDAKILHYVSTIEKFIKK